MKDIFSELDTLDEVQEVTSNRELHLIDLSPIFYWGVDKLRDCFDMSYVKQIVYQLSKFSGENRDIVVCADNSPTIKVNSIKDADKVYKTNRTSLEPFQKTHRATFDFAAKIICNYLGITFQSVEGFEADDMIYNTVRKFKQCYNKVIIHSADSDMLFMVDNTVSVDRGRFGIVNISNYPYTFSSGVMQYNTSTFYCICKKNKDNRGMLGSKMYPVILDNIKGISPYTFCDVNQTIEVASKFLNEEQMKVLRLALPLSTENSRYDCEILSPNKYDINKLKSLYYIMCKEDFLNNKFIDLYSRLVNYYGGHLNHV